MGDKLDGHKTDSISEDALKREKEKELRKSGDSNHKHSEKKKKTFNRLDERFQWNSTLDEDHIFPEEYEMIENLRTEFPELITWTEKFILYFIFSRRHNLTAIKEVLRKYITKQKQYGFDKNPPTYEQVKSFFNGAYFFLKGAVDKHDRMLLYYNIGLDLPKTTTLAQKYALMFWENTFEADVYTLRYLRNGLVIVVDFEKFGFKNFDMSSDAKEFYNAMTGVFPRRIRSMCVMNGGAVLKIALKAGKLILSKKIMKRISVIDKKSIKDLISDQWLLSKFGGTCKLNINDVISGAIQYEKELKEKTSVMNSSAERSSKANS